MNPRRQTPKSRLRSWAAKALALWCLFCLSSDLVGNEHIAVNFSENDGNQSWLNETDKIGPLSTPTSAFNTTNKPPGVPSLPTRSGAKHEGSLAGLRSTSGPTKASVTWKASTVWYSRGGVSPTNELRLSAGYLDDGKGGLSVTFSALPYSDYNVYLLLASDQPPGPNYTSLDFTVNDRPVIGGSFTAFRNLKESGGRWVEANADTVGNYIVARNVSGSPLVIRGREKIGPKRCSLAAVIIERKGAPFGGGENLPERTNTLIEKLKTFEKDQLEGLDRKIKEAEKAALALLEKHRKRAQKNGNLEAVIAMRKIVKLPPVADLPPDIPEETKAAIRNYHASVKSMRTEFRKEREKKRLAVAKILQRQLGEEVKARNIAGAVAIREELKKFPAVPKG